MKQKNGQMAAIIKKDIRGVAANKRMLAALLVVPLVMTILLPTIFILSFHFIPQEAGDLTRLLEMLPLGSREEISLYTLIHLMLNFLLPVFFLMIPLMASSVTAASSFVGEKEKRTLETLLYCPLSLGQIFRAKVAASFLLGMFVSLVSFAAMLAAVEIETVLILQRPVLPDAKWILVLLLVSPAVSLIAITLTVRFSAKAQSAEDAQQGAVFLLLPLILLIVGQFTGLFLLSGWILLLIGLGCAGLGTVLLRQAMRNFTYEKLLG